MDTEEVNDLNDHLNQIRKQKSSARLFTMIEVCFYATAVYVAIAVTFYQGEKIWMANRLGPEFGGVTYPIIEYLTSSNFILSLTPAIIPILFTLIFGQMPLAYIRRNFTSRSNTTEGMYEVLQAIKDEKAAAEETPTLESYYVGLALKSEKLSKSLYNREVPICSLVE